MTEAASFADTRHCLPSGRQYEISFEGQTVLVTEVGGALRDYLLDGRPLLDGYGPAEMCTGARGQSLIPWPNRIKGGSYEWEGQRLQLDLSEPDKGGAIHGLTRWRNWNAPAVEYTDGSIAFTYTLHACQGWPWILDCRLDYHLGPGGLTVRTAVTNRSASRCPYGTGAHPYLSTGVPTPWAIDAALVQVPGRTFLPVDERGIPTGHERVEGTEYDLRELQQLGGRHIDVAYSDLIRDADGRARVKLVRPDQSGGVELWVDASYPYLEIFTGDTLPQPDRRRTGLGVEPMTCAPDAFNSGEGLITLEPGQSHTGEWGITPL
ncbi:aldose 1-epimerase family protein [Pseudarthrobacter niigatensis]|uniref:Aldose 1-epimerase n=1 Tax=Pseudarthrobacter niigatensis TaxID=369935 RepID=A0AAJ1WEX5_9MICC|nr:aldose 1-epimerase family protein [Pseudarthrobacter niigatensis]MDQ0147764.1 aldose 1-epimerase [Pseudarthrobacter niigatensis]MDQ0267754.1 aldose 1-epimerase [Pseudarthrobacter niigatensis]